MNLFFLFLIGAVMNLSDIQSNDISATWNIDNTGEIGGFKTKVFGQPKVVETESGKAVEFNGIDDGLVVLGSPLDGAESFTIEVVFRPDSSSNPDNVEQRFVHIQNPTEEDKRILIELRLTKDEKWFLDTFIKSENSALTHYAENFPHPVNEWQYAALVYDKGVMKHYVNGSEEMTGNVDYSPITGGNVSVGMRMNQRSFFKGLIKTLRLTRKALKPEELLK